MERLVIMDTLAEAEVASVVLEETETLLVQIHLEEMVELVQQIILQDHL